MHQPLKRLVILLLCFALPGLSQAVERSSSLFVLYNDRGLAEIGTANVDKESDYSELSYSLSSITKTAGGVDTYSIGIGIGGRRYLSPGYASPFWGAGLSFYLTSACENKCNDTSDSFSSTSTTAITYPEVGIRLINHQRYKLDLMTRYWFASKPRIADKQLLYGLNVSAQF